MDTETYNRLKQFADEAATEKDRCYKDDWELGHDAGVQQTGSALQKLLAELVPTESAKG